MYLFSSELIPQLKSLNPNFYGINLFSIKSCHDAKIYIYIEKLHLCIQRLWSNFWAPCHISSHSDRWLSALWASLWLRDQNLFISWQTSSVMSSLTVKGKSPSTWGWGLREQSILIPSHHFYSTLGSFPVDSAPALRMLR